MESARSKVQNLGAATPGNNQMRFSSKSNSDVSIVQAFIFVDRTRNENKHPEHKCRPKSKQSARAAIGRIKRKESCATVPFQEVYS